MLRLLLFVLLVAGAVGADEAAEVRKVVKGYYRVYMLHPGEPLKTWRVAKPFLTPDIYEAVKERPQAVQADPMSASAGKRPPANGKLNITAVKVHDDAADAEVEVLSEAGVKAKVAVSLKKLEGHWRIDDFDNPNAGSIRSRLKK